MNVPPPVKTAIIDHVVHPNLIIPHDQNEKAWDEWKQEVVVYRQPLPADEKNAQSRTWRCLKTIDKFLSDLRFSKKRSDLAQFDIRQNHSWDEVLKVVDAAQDAYAAKAEGWTGLFRRGLRKAGESSTDGFVDPLLGLLPQDYYSCLISGGIKLLFGAAKARSTIRQTIIDELACLPETLSVAYEFRKIHPQDKRLNSCAINLYTVLVTAIEDSVKWLGGAEGLWEKTKDMVNMFGKQDHYGDYLRTDFDDVKAKAKGLVDRADMIQRSQVAETKKDTTEIMAKTSKIGGDTTEIKEDTAELIARSSKIQADASVIQGRTSRIEDDTTQLRGDASELKNKATKLGEDATDIKATVAQNQRKTDTVQSTLNYYAQALALAWQQQDHEREVARRREEAQHREMMDLIRSRTPNPLEQAPISQIELMAALSVDLETFAADVDSYSSTLRMVDAGTQNITRQVMNNPKFLRWFGTGESRSLLVHGRIHARISPFSFLNMALRLGLGDMNDVILLQFFCGRHQSDELRGVRGLMRSLIVQLLAIGQFDLSALHQQLPHDLANGDLHSLCWLFAFLVQGLGSGSTLFCLIDGVNVLEQSEHANELGFVISAMHDVLRDLPGNKRMKLFMSGADISNVVRQYTQQEDELYIMADSQESAFDQREASMQMRRAEQFSSIFHGQRSVDPGPQGSYEDDGFVEF